MDLPSVAASAATATVPGARPARRRIPPPRGLLPGRRAAWGRPWSRIGRRRPAGPGEEVAFTALHAIARAARPLRGGLNGEAARPAARHLRALLGARAVALIAVADPGPVPGGVADPAGCLLAWDGAGRGHHSGDAVPHALPVLATGRPRMLALDPPPCPDPRCPVRVAMVAPLTVEGRVVGAFSAYWDHPSAARVRAVGDVALCAAGQLELAERDALRARLAEAEVRALRAQISPHFVYNSLTTIASFVRTDPDRARELVLDFADFARYSFRNPRDFTTLAEELRSVDRYLLLERARFGDRLRFRVEVAPEVLPVAVPFLALQPLVENAVRHGMRDAREAFHISITARDAGTEAAISVEDDGVGMDPDRLRELLSAPLGRPGPTGWGSFGGGERPGGEAGPGIGLANVDERMRQVYGDEYGLTVETALGAGTKVRLRVPKCRPGIFPD
ncbi:histidine kinase [Spirillospora albida]|uniref:histidine kinase n=1 Tax=Spirillospora albida TaxID=58123 RepID=UPI0004C032D2|nr:histidine kinase [Spirillospora albida]